MSDNLAAKTPNLTFLLPIWPRARECSFIFRCAKIYTLSFCFFVKQPTFNEFDGQTLLGFNRLLAMLRRSNTRRRASHTSFGVFWSWMYSNCESCILDTSNDLHRRSNLARASQFRSFSLAIASLSPASSFSTSSPSAFVLMHSNSSCSSKSIVIRYFHAV